MIQFLIRRNRDITKKINRRAKKEENFVYKEKGYYYLKEFEYTKNTINYLNYHYPSGIFRLVETEYGGQQFDIFRSKAQIVCGTEGEKLVPIKRFNHGDRINKDHAMFLGSSLCVIQCNYKYHPQREYDIEFRVIRKEINKYTGEYKETQIWKGLERNAVNCPIKYIKYKKAILACIEKIKDFNCIDAYYYEN